MNRAAQLQVGSLMCEHAGGYPKGNHDQSGTGRPKQGSSKARHPDGMALPSQHLHQKQVGRLDFGAIWEIEEE